MAGNFNMTNNDELFDHLVNIGQHPRAKNDTVTVLEKVGHFLDEENERLYSRYRQLGYSKKEISPLIAENLSLTNVLQEAAEDLDGGYAMGGMTGHGDAFMFRDPNGIRPAYYYKDDEVLVVASERPAIKTAFNLPFEAIQEVKPGHALIAKKDGNVYEEEILKPKQQTSCSFERIYFSRGTDEEIYHERKALGRQLTPDVLESVDYNFRDTVFSYIPNTAETAFIGLLEGLGKYLDQYKHDQIQAYPDMNSDQLKNLLNLHPRHEQLAVKDAKLRTFIADDTQRDDLVAHVYDSTYGVVRPDQDTVVVLDDSIVRGTTLRQSIISILGRLRPQKIVIVSSAPQIRYPDCYGIDMSKIQDFIAFRAAIALLKEYGLDNRIDEVYEACKRAEALPPAEQTNEVKRIYEPLKTADISRKIAELITPPGVTAEVDVIFQGIDSLHEACPKNQGDWYFTGNFPTPGGTRVINRAYVNFYENRNVRAY
jgi:amidophosphoribosyltransferase